MKIILIIFVLTLCCRHGISFQFCHGLICLNGGTCVQWGREQYFCICTRRYKGRDCSQKVTLTDVIGPECGKQEFKNVFPRIIGGEQSEEGRWPWNAQLKILTHQEATMCGGSIIGKRWIISALHCVDSLFTNQTTQVKVYLGSNRVYNGKLYYIDKVFYYKTIKFNFNLNSNNSHYLHDIALLRTRKKITYNKYVQPICLPPYKLNDYEKFNTIFYVIGFGRFIPGEYVILGDSVSHYLRHTTVKLDSDRTCRTKYGIPYIVCTHKTGIVVHDSCLGDSGGSLSAKKNGKWTLYGITSGGIGYCTGDGYYVNVFHYLDWIRDTLLDHS
ncbi:hypothetical protein SNEBB_000400 [Seison nebaliae]|nr:hypothetical protein SNEBB_000400 [Seison nebaliae]